MRTKFLLMILLVLNYSIAFGAIEAAHIPDEDHPYGHAVDFHDHGENKVHDADHDSQTHGIQCHFNCDLPSNPEFAFPYAGNQFLTTGISLHKNLAYSPPVPPPNSL